MILNIKKHTIHIPTTTRASMLVKFESSKYIDSFIKSGILHFGSTKYYRMIELKNNNVGIGDRYDGLYTFSKNELMNLGMSIDGYKVDAKHDVVGFNYSCNQYIFCMSVINIIRNLSNRVSRNKLKSDFYQAFFSDIRYPKKIIVIVNPRDFFNKLTFALLLLGYNSSDIVHMPVIYSNYRNYMAHVLYNKSHYYRGPLYWINFVKNTKFKNEREFRISIPSLFAYHTGLNIPIGNLENDVLIFNNLNDFINQTILTF